MDVINLAITVNLWFIVCLCLGSIVIGMVLNRRGDKWPRY